jgi:hypothetical protein
MRFGALCHHSGESTTAGTGGIVILLREANNLHTTRDATPSTIRPLYVGVTVPEFGSVQYLLYNFSEGFFHAYCCLGRGFDEQAVHGFGKFGSRLCWHLP